MVSFFVPAALVLGFTNQAPNRRKNRPGKKSFVCFGTTPALILNLGFERQEIFLEHLSAYARDMSNASVWAVRASTKEKRRRCVRAGETSASALCAASLFFRSQQWEQDHVANGLCAGEQHREPIHPDPNPAGRRHAVLERE